MLLHINPGTMLSLEDAYAKSHWGTLRRWARRYLRPLVEASADAPKVRQAYWPQYFHELLREQDTNLETQHYLRRYRLCDGADAWGALLARAGARAARGAASHHDDFLLLGGQARPDRGLVFLELSRLDLLRRARWSAGRFAYCSVANESLTKRFASAGPFEAAEASELLGNAANGAPLVRKLCAQLPKVLDVDPTNREGSMSQAKHSLWQGVHFALVFETSIPTGVDILREHLLFATEKPLKPIQALRPFVMLGTVGSLALLRALGFRTDFGGLNASYDRRLWSSRRTHNAIEQVQHLLQLSPDGHVGCATLSTMCTPQSGPFDVRRPAARAASTRASRMGYRGWYGASRDARRRQPELQVLVHRELVVLIIFWRAVPVLCYGRRSMPPLLLKPLLSCWSNWDMDVSLRRCSFFGWWVLQDYFVLLVVRVPTKQP